MPGTDLLELEATIKRVPGVLGCVILTSGKRGVGEIQAFIQTGESRERIEGAIRKAVTEHGLTEPRAIQVFELEAELGDRQTLKRAAELAEQDARGGRAADATPHPAPAPPAPPGPSEAKRARPVLARVLLSSGSRKSAAQVTLGSGPGEVVGAAEDEKTPHGLRVLAQATLEACERLVPGLAFDLKGASLVTTFGREAVLVLVSSGEQPETIGAALVREGPTSEAAVRATLDAVNRRIARAR